MQLASVAPSSASSLSKQVLQRKRFKILGEHESNSNFHKEDKVKLLRFLAPPFVAAVIALSPISNPPVSVGQTLDVQKGATLFRRACIGCHDAGGNIIQPGATLFLKDLQRNGVDTEEEIYRVTYYGKGRMPGFGENCTPRGQCTFGARLQEDEIKLLAQFVKSQADQGWPKIETQGD
ncbi:Cytochrome c [Perilla frutescens var. hirtella]|uniref:Cytochrome c-553 n=1 Tax=Perilla frutescens var. hirtella TaxID=608512 RepID=A0AAD4IQC2_PERFH|nr:Cytochrome c [Perilla frutescens var. hirtella]KAH6764839.1 Cytochrome c [Perilla frutescens var. frutescens]KAH6776264.1 Cytochrome c [Perilla frutescens var. hirtella]